MGNAGYVVRNLDSAQEQSFDQLDDALDAVQAPFVAVNQSWAVFDSGERVHDRTPIAVGTGPFGADSSSIIGCRSDVIAGSD